MRLPSLDDVAASALRSAARFPLVIAVALLGTIAALGSTISGTGTEFTRLVLTAMLGIPLLFSLTLAAEQSARPARRWIFPAVGVATLVAFWWFWTGWSSPTQTLRYIQLSVAFHLLVAFAPYTASARPNGFWQYNKILFLRFLTALLYSWVLYAGLAIALAAVDKLFGAGVSPKSYLRLWIVIAFLFNTWFFLAGIPEDLAALDERTDYPPGLRVFAQNVLVPIVVLYLTILTAYLAKVLFTRQWPNGWIGYLVSSVAVLGLLAWLLVYPLEEREEFAWVKTFTRGFYIALMPAIVMLWFAIYKRVSEYGVTEPRYFLIVLSVWLAGISLWYTFTRSRNIKLIPASLCALAVLTFAGPTGAYAVSTMSQTNRLDAILARNGLLQNGRLHLTGRAVSLDDRKEISGVLRYLLESHGVKALGPWLPDSLRKSIGTISGGYGAESSAKTVMAAMNLEFVGPASAGAGGEYFSVAVAAPRDAISIDGFTYALRMPYWNVHDSVQVGSDYIMRFSEDGSALQLSRGAEVVLTIPLQGVADRADEFRRVHGGGATIPSELLRVDAENDRAVARAYFTMLSGTKHLSGVKLNSFAGELFLRLK
jgi:hypothetical protein